MRLTDLHPRFVGAGGEGVYTQGPPCAQCFPNADGSRTACEACDGRGYALLPAPERHGVGVICSCPCGQAAEEHELYVPFANPLDGGPPLQTGKNNGWQRTGDTFETLTLTPSILRAKANGGCGWHGFITNGDVTGQVER